MYAFRFAYQHFCRLVQKGAVVTFAISGVTGPILIKFAHDVATILPLNICKWLLPDSYPFQNASLPNEGHIANFAQNWLPWQRPLRYQRKGPDRSSAPKTVHRVTRLQKNRSNRF